MVVERMEAGEAEGLGPRNQWNPGPAVVWTPMIWLGRAVHSLDGETRYGLGCDGPISEFALFGTAIMAFLAVWLTFRMARRHFGEGPALLSGPGGQPCASAWLLGAALERWVGRVGWLLRMRRHLQRG